MCRKFTTWDQQLFFYLFLYIKEQFEFVYLKNNYTMMFLNLFYFQPRLVSATHRHFQVVSKTVGLQFVDVLTNCIPTVLDTT